MAGLPGRSVAPRPSVPVRPFRGRLYRLCARLLAILPLCAAPAAAQSPEPPDVPAPRAELIRATVPVILPGGVDSNSPAVWTLQRGLLRLHVTTSIDGRPSVAAGPNLARLGQARSIDLDPWPGGGVWMEAIVPDVDGTWYGYFHNEIPSPLCEDQTKMAPRIGAARSVDSGASWEYLGVILEAPPESVDCGSPNTYFVGGVGDFSVQLSPDGQDLYLFYSAYPSRGARQGIAAARLAWADRDAPVGKIMVWHDTAWLPATTAPEGDEPRVRYPLGVPLFPTPDPFHGPTDTVDAFWGPSVHWNTHLEQYVMLMNHALDESFGQEGIYVSFSPTLDDPHAWTPPAPLLTGGRWYPQVLGLDLETGTDRTAGEYARFFMGGRSDYLIRFVK